MHVETNRSCPFCHGTGEVLIRDGVRVECTCTVTRRVVRDSAGVFRDAEQAISKERSDDGIVAGR